jgi:hypothetical protein
VSASSPVRRAGHLSDDTARRLAWAAFGVIIAGYLAAVLSGFMPDRRTDPEAPWGWHEPIGDFVFGTIMLVFPVVGLTIARQQPKNRIGWLLLANGFAWMGTSFNDLYVRYGALTNPGSLPRPDVAAVLAEGSWVFAVGLLGTFLILLFPDGHLPSHRWRVVGWLSGISIGFIYLLITVAPGRTSESDIRFRNPFGIQALKPLGEVVFLPILLLPLCILACAVALVMRYRRSTGVERLQLKWLATSGALFAATYLVAMVLGALRAFDVWGGGGWGALIDASFAVWFALIPVSIGFAVLKHRLYEIDVVINRAVVFGALAVFITAVYIAIVVGVGAALGQGGRPNLALSIAATAVVAIAFQPVRERVQRFANRLVYGRRATPYEVMSNFAARMGGAYGATDLLPRMARTVAEGVGARQVEVWLKIGSAYVREASWPDSSGATPRRASRGHHRVEGARRCAHARGGQAAGRRSVTGRLGAAQRAAHRGPAQLTAAAGEHPRRRAPPPRAKPT